MYESFVDWADVNILVTGASGMVGSWLIKKLIKKKSKIVALARDIDFDSEFFRSGEYLKTSIVNGSLENYSLINRILVEYKIDTVFHLGAQTLVNVAQHDPLQTFESNIRGTYNVLEACRRNKGNIKRIIIASSDKAYGITNKLPYTENMPLKGCHPYDVSKSCADLLAQTYHHTYNMPIVITRCGNIYGGGDLNWSRIVPGTIRSLLHNKRPIIRSDGKYIRDYIYIEDIVEAYIILAESITKKNISGESFNFGTESPTTVLEIVKDISTLLGINEIKPEILNLQIQEIHEQYLSIEKSKKVLKWKPIYSLKKGLSETIKWYQKYFEAVSFEN